MEHDILPDEAYTCPRSGLVFVKYQNTLLHVILSRLAWQQCRL